MSSNTAVITASQVLSKSLTMVVINPWAYLTPTEALLQIGTTVALKAASYLGQSLSYLVSMSTALQRELTQQAFQLADIAIAQMVAAPNIAKYYMFRLNPSKLDKSFAKVRTNVQTGAGLVMDTFANNGITYVYSGTQGMMRPALSVLRMPQLTPAWHYLQLFEEFFLKHKSDLIFVLDEEAAVGRFDSFSYGLDADNPWRINYRFQVTMYPDTKFSLFSGYIGSAFAAIKPLSVPPSAIPGLSLLGEEVNPSNVNVFEDTWGTGHINELGGIPL